MDWIVIVGGIVLLVMGVSAYNINKEISAAPKKPVEPTKPKETTEESETTFTKEELAEAVQKGIEERDKKKKEEEVKNTNMGCLGFIVFCIILWFLIGESGMVDEIIDWIESIPTD